MLKLIAIVVTNIIVFYLSLNITVKFINYMDGSNITSKKVNFIFLSAVSGIAIGVLYIKYSFSIDFFKYCILIIYLVITGYLDYKVRNVYRFLSSIFLVIGILSLIFSFKDENILQFIQTYLISIAGTFILPGFLAFGGMLGWGDVEVFCTVSVYLKILGVVNVFLAFSFAGIGAIFKILARKAKLKDVGPLCPYIALSTYTLLLLA